MYGIHFREELNEVTARELDALISRLKAFLLLEHNEDGTHKKATLTSATNPANDDDSAAATANDSRWWRGPGAWSLDDPTATNKHVVGLRPPDPPAGTYNNYAPPGIDDAVVLEIEGTGDITLTGLKAAPNSRKRFLLLRNRDSTNSITLSDNNTSSEVQNRFDLPAVTGTAGSGALLDASHNTDTVAQAVTRGSLVYGNSTPAWDELVIGAANRLLRSNGTDVSWAQAALATDVSGVLPVANGGTGSSTAGITTVTKNLTDAELKALFTTPITVLAAPGVNKVNWPIGLCIRTTVTGAGLDEPLYSLRYVGTTAAIFTSTIARFTSTGVGIGIVDLNALEYSSATAADAVNKAIEVLFNFNPSGAGLVATATVHLVYQTIDTV